MRVSTPSGALLVSSCGAAARRIELCRVAASWELDIRNPRFADIASSLLERPSIMKPGLSLPIGMFFPDVHGDSCRGHTQHIRIDAEPPQIPEHQQVYDVLTQRQWLEKIQEIYDVFKLPTDSPLGQGVAMASQTLGTSRAQLRSVTNIWKAFGKICPR